MAEFTRTNGDLKPVLNADTGTYVNTGVNAVATGETVQNMGPRLKFYTITFTGTVTGDVVLKAMQVAQQLATVHIYEYTTAANDTLAVAAYGMDAWGDLTATGPGTFDQALTDAVGAAVSVTLGATFTN